MSERSEREVVTEFTKEKDEGGQWRRKKGHMFPLSSFPSFAFPCDSFSKKRSHKVRTGEAQKGKGTKERNGWRFLFSHSLPTLTHQ